MIARKIGLLTCSLFAFFIPLLCSESEGSLECLTTTISEIYHISDDEILYVLDEGSVWTEDLDENENPSLSWKVGDEVAIANPYDPSLNAYDVVNVTCDDQKELLRLGKTTKIPNSILELTPDEANLGTSTHLVLEEAGHWILIYDQEDLQNNNTAVSWEVGDSILLIVDPADDWNLYPNDKGIFKFWWDFYFLNIDRNMMIDPHSFPNSE